MIFPEPLPSIALLFCPLISPPDITIIFYYNYLSCYLIFVIYLQFCFSRSKYPGQNIFHGSSKMCVLRCPAWESIIVCPARFCNGHLTVYSHWGHLNTSWVFLVGLVMYFLQDTQESEHTQSTYMQHGHKFLYIRSSQYNMTRESDLLLCYQNCVFSQVPLE